MYIVNLLQRDILYTQLLIINTHIINQASKIVMAFCCITENITDVILTTVQNLHISRLILVGLTKVKYSFKTTHELATRVLKLLNYGSIVRLQSKQLKKEVNIIKCTAPYVYRVVFLSAI